MAVFFSSLNCRFFGVAFSGLALGSIFFFIEEATNQGQIVDPPSLWDKDGDNEEQLFFSEEAIKLRQSTSPQLSRTEAI